MNFRWIVVLVLFGAAIASAQDSPAAPADFYVAVSGSDGNPGTLEQPFATPERARQAVREKIAQGLKQPVTVLFRGGRYALEKTLVLGPEDSGTKDRPVTYAAYPGETPVFSGGKVISGWEPEEKGRWKAKTDIPNFRQLWVNDLRGVRARGIAPKKIELWGENGYRTGKVELAEWKQPSELEFCYLIMWCHTYAKVKSIHRDGEHAIIEMLQPYFTHCRRKEGVRIQIPQDYMENAIELLDEPGEWYLDRAAGTVYYIPREREDMAKAEVIAPLLETLLEIRGTLDSLVHDICFKGICFSHATWLTPSEKGLADVQANFALNPDAPLERDNVLASVHNEYIKSPANVVCHAAKGIRFERCTFERLGGAGLDIESGSQDNLITNCHFRDIAGSGIQIGDVLREDHHPKDIRSVVKNNQVTDCLIEDCAADYKGGLGIFVGYTEETVLAHNEIRNLPYSGISMGWGWGEEDAGGGAENYYQPFKFDTPTTAKNNRIEYNHIHHVLLDLWDGGGIYTLGNMPGTVIRGNYVHDNVGIPGGIYLDEGSGFIEVSGNVVEYVRTPMNFNNRNQNRIATCPVKDNWFASRNVSRQGAAAAAVEAVTGKAGIRNQ